MIDPSDTAEAKQSIQKTCIGLLKAIQQTLPDNNQKAVKPARLSDFSFLDLSQSIAESIERIEEDNPISIEVHPNYYYIMIPLAGNLQPELARLIQHTIDNIKSVNPRMKEVDSSKHAALYQKFTPEGGIAMTEEGREVHVAVPKDRIANFLVMLEHFSRKISASNTAKTNMQALLEVADKTNAISGVKPYPYVGFNTNGTRVGYSLYLQGVPKDLHAQLHDKGATIADEKFPSPDTRSRNLSRNLRKTYSGRNRCTMLLGITPDNAGIVKDAVDEVIRTRETGSGRSL